MSKEGQTVDPELKFRVVQEMRELRDNELPKPAPDWDVIWVLSAYEMEHGAKDGVRNESRDRLLVGLDLVRQVAAVRAGKQSEELSSEDVQKHGPTLYYNGTAAQKIDIAQRQPEWEEAYGAAVEKIMMTKSDAIKHTGHQFLDFPRDLQEQARKIVIVSDIYHLPRVNRYPFAHEKVVLYPAGPKAVGFKNALREARKIPQYIESGILPPEREDK